MISNLIAILLIGNDWKNQVVAVINGFRQPELKTNSKIRKTIGLRGEEAVSFL